MNNSNYKIFIDYDEDTLNIVKVPSKEPVKTIEGKYGIQIKIDIDGNAVEIIIPEPEILFGIDLRYIESFLIINYI